VDWSYPPDAEAFRAEVGPWLDANLPADLRGVTLRDIDRTGVLESLRGWNRTLADAGYAAIGWPVEFGGRDAGVFEQLVLAEELSRVDAPTSVNPIGLSNIAPAIMAFGTDDQKQRLLPRMLRGDDIWCQGFSEPDAGSDLASLRTTAVADGDHFVVNGQKVWTTLANLADWCELLVRTDPSAPKHRGISCLLVDMSLPGVEVRPLVTATGEHEFNEMFFDDVRVPANALLGPLNDGWGVAMGTLTYERAGVAQLHLMVRKRIARLVDLAKERGVDSDSVIRRQLARLHLEGEYLKLLADRAMSAAAAGRPPGPESSVVKLWWAEVHQHVVATAADVLGVEANSGEWGRERVAARSLTIAGGTTQVNKNLVAQRILGLPKE
jgi:alkylation response protein AidB-like acyl-CoA dehydrogenase